MFERVKVDNTQELGGVSVEIELDSGATQSGRFAIPVSKTVFDVLNGAGGFIEFEPFEGERRILAKATLRSVRLLSPPKAGELARKLRDIDGFDPHAVLGVKAGSAWEDVRGAYHRLAKSYHPDRYANAELPAEVRDYLAGMARRVNAAYAALEAPHQAARQATGPVYTRSGR
jgi:hypothetical protein